MKSIERILCVIDPTIKVQPALERAAWLSQRTGAELELFICFYNEYLSGEHIFDTPYLQEARGKTIDSKLSYLEELAAPLRKSAITVTTNVVWDHPLYEGVARHAIASKADIVFKDTHHHSAIQRVLLTNTDWNLIRTCPAPLWLVKIGDFPEKPVFIASIDPTHEHDKPAALDDSILRTCRLLAESTNADLHAFHSFDPRIMLAAATTSAYIPASLPYQEIEQNMREHHGRRFDEVISSHEIDDDHKHLVSGATHEELPELSRQLDADLVVMGAIARNRWKRLFVGATAERTLERLPCDMLVIKPDWFETPVDKKIEGEAT